MKMLIVADALTRLDGSPLHYTNWRSRAPDASDISVDSCVTLRVLDAVWQLADCTERLGFICKTSTGKRHDFQPHDHKSPAEAQYSPDRLIFTAGTVPGNYCWL